MAVQQDELMTVVRKVLVEFLPELNEIELEPTTSISEVGVESMAIVEAIGHLEDHFQVVIPDDELTEIDSIADFTRILNRHIPKS